MKTLIIALVMSPILIGCTSSGLVATRTCGTVATPASCTGNPDNPKVTINTNALNFAPPNLCAKVGTTIEFKLVPPGNNVIGNAAVLPKNALHTWLIGTNSPDKDKIYVKVPDWVVDGDYNYGFLRNNGDCIDPRVEVTH